MSDRHDPKLSIRPPGERKPDQRPDARKSEDPLVELARIVSNRSSSIGDTANRQTPTGESKPSVHPGGAPLPSESDLARDLEEELLNELQASFSMVPEVVGQAAAQMSVAPPPPVITNEPTDEAVEEPQEPQTPPEVASPQQSDEPELAFQPAKKSPVNEGGETLYDDILNDLLNLESESSGEAEPQPPEPPAVSPRPQQIQQSPAVETRRRQPEPQPQPQPQEVKAEAPRRPEAVRIKPPQAAVAKRESLASRIARAAQNGERGEPATPRARPPVPRPPTQTQRPAAVRPAPPVERRRQSDSAEFLPPNASPPPRQVESRWDPPLEREAEPAFDPSRFAPLPSESFQPEQHGGSREADIPADDLFFASGEGTFFEDSAPAEEQLEAVPGYSDEELSAYSDEDLAAMQPRRSRRVPLAIAALLGVLVIGGVAVFMFRSGGSSGPPQIITADATPTKITPDNAGVSDGDSQSKLIYDRVDPNSEIDDSQLVVAGNDPIADIPPIPEDTASSDVSRVILGGGPVLDRPPEETGSMDELSMPAGGSTTIASEAAEPPAIGPKKVRTVVVRPDGTIVSSEAVAPEEDQATSQDDVTGTLAELPPASETPPAPGADENPLLSDNFGTEATDDPGPDVPAPNNPIEESASIPDIAPPAPPAARPAASAPTVVATPGSSNGPIDVTPANTPQSASGGLGGGFLVQVSSQRSEATALETFSELQRRYPSILGDRAPNIQRADLGERGIYYRVRVGYPTREQAVRMCENLKAAGGDCLLATR